MRFWNWLWTLSGVVGVILSIFKLRLTTLQMRIAEAQGLADDHDNRILLNKYRRDSLIRGSTLILVTLAGIASFQRPKLPPFSEWDWPLWVQVPGFELIAFLTVLGVLLDLRDRLRLIYGSVGNWLRRDVGTKAPGL